MNKGAIFDVDGTLLDSMPIWDDASERFLTGLGVKAEPGLSDIMFRMSLDEGAAYLKSAYGLDLSEQEIKDGILGVIRDFYFYQAQPKPGPRIFLLAADRMGLEPADIFVFEDVIHAIRTANRAGFVTVGVYDAASSSDNTAIREESGLYLHSLENWERFRDFALHAAK